MTDVNPDPCKDQGDDSGSACPCDEKHSFSKRFTEIASCGCSAASGAALSHVGCVLVPVFASAAGVVSSAALHTAMYVASPVIAIGFTLGIDKARGEKLLSAKSARKAGVAGTIALAVTFTISAFQGHDHHEHHSATPDAAMEWYGTLPENEQQRISEIATKADITTKDYVSELRGIDALDTIEEQRLRDVVGEQCPCTVPGACKVPGLMP